MLTWWGARLGDRFGALELQHPGPEAGGSPFAIWGRAPLRATPISRAADDGLTPVERVLRGFDLAGKFGPAAGISR